MVRCSIALIGVDFIAPVMTRKACFWTLSSTLWFVFDEVIQAGDPYSRWGLIVPWYAVFSISSFAPQLVPASFRSIASFFRALVSACAIWGFHVSRLNMLNLQPRFLEKLIVFWFINLESITIFNTNTVKYIILIHISYPNIKYINIPDSKKSASCF